MIKKTNPIIKFLLKFLYYTSFILLIISIFLAEYSETKEQQIIFGVLIFVSVGIMILIVYFDGKYFELSNKMNAKRIKIKCNNFSDILKKLSTNLNYEKNELIIDDDTKGFIFQKIKKSVLYGQKISYITVVHLDEFNEKKFTNIVEATGRWFDKNTGDVYESNYIETTIIMCLNNNSNKFINFINKPIEQLNNFIKVSIGIILNERSLYISNSKTSLYKRKYKKMVNRILNIIK